MEQKYMTPIEVVEAFWKGMQTNDFARAARWLTDDFFCDWPQSGERIIGPGNFVEINRRYPAAGPWNFEIVKLLVQGSEVVSDVLVTDGEVNARTITFHQVEGERISRQTEFWPEQYAPPAWRSPWVSTPDHQSGADHPSSRCVVGAF